MKVCMPIEPIKQIERKFEIKDNSDLTVVSSQNIEENGKPNGRYDRLELNVDHNNTAEFTPERAPVVTIPARYSWEAAEAFNNLLEKTFKTSKRLNLSFGEHSNFVSQECRNWVADIRESDPGLFTEWLRLHEGEILNGRTDLAFLPSDFTKEDYYSYIDKYR